MGTLTSAPIEGGTDDDDSVKLKAPEDDPPAGDDAGLDGGVDPGDAGAGDGGTSDGGTDGGTGISCAAALPCASATDLGSVSGDKGGTKMATGSTSQWFKVKVTEDDDDPLGEDLKVRAVLTSPTGTNFDLYMYAGGSKTTHSCAGVTKSSTLSTTTDTVNDSWGEGFPANGNDDGKYITFEVRHVSGTCAASSQWTLTVYGDQ